MAFFESSFTQDATYWPPDRPDGYGGDAAGSPEPRKCRWQRKSTQFLDQHGELAMSDSVVYLSGDVLVGGFLALGANADADDRAQIRRVDISPSLDGNSQLVKAML